MVTILINNNNKAKLLGGLIPMTEIQKAFKIRNPNAFFIRKM